ncbi:MAG: VWA domain-containing protein [Alphaproteobacteria bacterium]
MSGAGGRLWLNLMHFARLLRAAGFPLGTGEVARGMEALSAVGLRRRDDAYWALHAVFVDRQDRHAIFDEAFRLFWRSLDRGGEAPLADGGGARLSRRLAEALEAAGERPAGKPGSETIEPRPGSGDEGDGDTPRLQARPTYSARDVAGDMDFGQMSAAELAEAEAAIRRLALPDDLVRRRRFRVQAEGPRVDLRASLAASHRTGGDVIRLVRRAPIAAPPPLVALIDISGSMSNYSRVMLRFMHRLGQARGNVHCFLFGTRLTNVTRMLRQRDGDTALADVAEKVRDWSGGTRIGPSLHDFNFDWSRRVLTGGATVLLVTDGLERDPGGELAAEMARLRRASRRLVWLNPHLRNTDYALMARGARAIRPYVTDFRPVHNMTSLAALVTALSRSGPRGSRRQAA